MRLIREYTPFLMLALTFLAAILSHFKCYSYLYNYLSDLIGYSIATNVFMLSVYLNGRYCFSTKATVVALMLMNVLNIFSMAFNYYSEIYDFYITIIITIITILILLTEKGKKCYYKLKK